MVDVAAAADGDVVGEEFERDGFEDGEELGAFDRGRKAPPRS